MLPNSNATYLSPDPILDTYVPKSVDPKYQFEDNFSGEEDAVLNKLSSNEDNQFVSPHESVPIPKSSQEESDSTNINSDSLSSSILSNSSNPSVSCI